MHEFADGPVFAGATSLRNGHIGLVGELGQLPVGLRVVLNLRVGEVFLWSGAVALILGHLAFAELPLGNVLATMMRKSLAAAILAWQAHPETA